MNEHKTSERKNQKFNVIVIEYLVTFCWTDADAGPECEESSLLWNQ